MKNQNIQFTCLKLISNLKFDCHNSFIKIHINENKTIDLNFWSLQLNHLDQISESEISIYLKSH